MAKEQAKQKEVGICLIKGCGAAVKSRGLCVHHYSIARGRVAAGTGTWQAFEAAGIALPSKGGATGVRVAQFDAALRDAHLAA